MYAKNKLLIISDIARWHFQAGAFGKSVRFLGIYMLQMQKLAVCFQVRA